MSKQQALALAMLVFCVCTSVVVNAAVCDDLNRDGTTTNMHYSESANGVWRWWTRGFLEQTCHCNEGLQIYAENFKPMDGSWDLIETFRTCQECPTGESTVDIYGQYTKKECNIFGQECEYKKYAWTGITPEIRLHSDADNWGKIGYCYPCGIGNRRNMEHKMNNPNREGDYSGRQKRIYTNMGCVRCLGGKYQPSSSQDECLICTAGKYAAGLVPADQNAIISVAGHGNTRCDNCPDGMDSPAESYNSAACSNCAAGKASAGGNPCSQCPAGKYSAARAAQCSNCLAGQESAAGASSCTACASNEANPSSGGACAPCSAGQYRASASQCGNCGIREISAAGAVICSICAEGEYATASNTRCEGCPAGKYGINPQSSSECVQCERGKYQNNVGQTECLHCAAGKETANIGSDNINDCVDCADGFVNAGPSSGGLIGIFIPFSINSNNAGICEECVAGTYARDRTACVPCPARHFSAAGAMGCTECDDNEFSDDERSDCIECPSGKIKRSPIMESDCEACGAGFYAEDRFFYECIQCPIGTQSPPLSSSRDDCEPCDAGFGGTPCIMCSPGKYSVLSEGSRTCVDCPAGKYGPLAQSLSIHDCKDCPADRQNSAPGSDAESDCSECPANLYFDPVEQDCMHCKFPRAFNSEALWDPKIPDTGVYTCELCPSHAIPQFLPEQSAENDQICNTILPLEADGSFVQEDTYISFFDTSKYVCNTGFCQAVPGRIVSRLLVDSKFVKNNLDFLGTGLTEREILNTVLSSTKLFIDGEFQNKNVWNIALAVCKAPYFCDPKAAFDIEVSSKRGDIFYDTIVYENQSNFQNNALGNCSEGHVILQHAASDSTACIDIPNNMVILPGTPGTVNDYMESVNLHKDWYRSITRRTIEWDQPPDQASEDLYAQVRNVQIAALPQESARIACNAGYELSIPSDGITAGVSTQEIGLDPTVSCVSCVDNHYSLGGATQAPTTNPNAVAGYCKPCEQDCHVSTYGWSFLLAYYNSTEEAFNLCPGSYQECSTSNGETICQATGSGQNLKSYDFLSLECGWQGHLDAQIQKYGCGGDSPGFCGCPAGHFMQITHSTNKQCTNAHGIYNSPNADCSIQCVQCAPGYVGNALGYGDTCTQCVAGQQPSSDQSICEECQAGFFSTDGYLCETCNYGPTDVIKQSNPDPDNWNYTATGGTACDRCNSGYYYDQNTNPQRCIACPSGTWKAYNPFENDAICQGCTGCAAGEYVEACDPTDGGNLVCATCDCATGTYCVVDDLRQHTCQECNSCPAGQENQGCGEFDAGICIACPTGKYKISEGTSPCSNCELCPAMQQRTLDCGGDSAGECVSCIHGQYSQGNDDVCEACSACGAGTFDPCCAWGNALHEDWYCGIDGSNSNVGCDSCGAPAPSTCQPCPVDHYKTNTSGNYCDACVEAMPYGKNPECADFHQLQGCGGSSIGTCTQCQALQYFDACTNTCVDLPSDNKRIDITCTNSQETVGSSTIECSCWLEENFNFAIQIAVWCGRYAVPRDQAADDTEAGICRCMDGYEPFIPENDDPASQCVGDECCKKCSDDQYSTNSQPCSSCTDRRMFGSMDSPRCQDLHQLVGCGDVSSGTCKPCPAGFFFDVCHNTCTRMPDYHRRIDVSCDEFPEHPRCTACNLGGVRIKTQDTVHCGLKSRPWTEDISEETCNCESGFTFKAHITTSSSSSLASAGSCVSCSEKRVLRCLRDKQREQMQTIATWHPAHRGRLSEHGTRELCLRRNRILCTAFCELW